MLVLGTIQKVRSLKSGVFDPPPKDKWSLAVMLILVPEEKSPLKGLKRDHFFSKKRDQKGTKNDFFTKKGPPEHKRYEKIPNVDQFLLVN